MSIRHESVTALYQMDEVIATCARKGLRFETSVALTWSAKLHSRAKLEKVEFLARQISHQTGIRRGLCQIALGDRFITRSGSVEKGTAASD